MRGDLKAFTVLQTAFQEQEKHIRYKGIRASRAFHSALFGCVERTLQIKQKTYRNNRYTDLCRADFFNRSGSGTPVRSSYPEPFNRNAADRRRIVFHRSFRVVYRRRGQFYARRVIYPVYAGKHENRSGIPCPGALRSKIRG